ncbi:hypothetical protein Mapa_002084 [Marchantia paleacea]|nr:hypothetical protein Mapa_002084 [Marchantia paleacea]
MKASQSTSRKQPGWRRASKQEEVARRATNREEVEKYHCFPAAAVVVAVVVIALASNRELETTGKTYSPPNSGGRAGGRAGSALQQRNCPGTAAVTRLEVASEGSEE